jgi:hypothetical protein
LFAPHRSFAIAFTISLVLVRCGLGGINRDGSVLTPKYPFQAIRSQGTFYLAVEHSNG